MENTATHPLAWTPELATGDARMDETHEAFVALLNQLMSVSPEAQMPLYLQVIDHTVDHFAQEERWMQATGFAPDNCHALQHASILETMQAVRTHTEQGDTTLIGRLAEALAEWFPQHAATMDAGLALHLASLGYDTQTETLPDPQRVRPASMSGCGSVSCGTG
ncbi:MAG: bacteriohemerythrin [Hydrogenophaga sp.]|uniref:bacteriohemerythrin n=1 Tax=Hydrogenophaga sp. TaxID=1904254 RepID=UPI003D0CBDE6